MTDSIVIDALRGERALLDVRAPCEFARGSFPHAVNLPILNDDERQQVGTTYKQEGREAATLLGHQLVGGVVREQRVQGWSDFVSSHPGALVCCWRGGMRSKIAAQWLSEAGHECERVPGGFKAIRQAGVELFAEVATDSEWLIVGGMTGSGKTRIIEATTDAVDLEGVANHRGSSFGARAEPQPTQVSFDNRLAVDFARRCSASPGGGSRMPPRIVVEDEGRTIGRLAIPEVIVQRMRRSPIVVVEASLETRVQNIVTDYIDEPSAEGASNEALRVRYREALSRLRKRLGDERWRQIDGQMVHAFNGGKHGEWIESLLTHYYDKTYTYQLDKKRDRVVFSGPAPAVLDWLSISAA